MVTKMHPSSFNKLSKFEKLDKLGEGTYGVVYKARGILPILTQKFKKIIKTKPIMSYML